MKYEIIEVFGMNVVDTIDAENRRDALNKFAEKNGLAQNAREDLRWFELRHSYAAAEVGVNTKAKEFAERFIRESLKHVHTPENVGELKALLKHQDNVQTRRLQLRERAERNGAVRN